MKRRALAVLLAAPALAWARSRPRYGFGLLAADGDGGYRLETETARIPRKYKDSGLRFGVEFTNWDRLPLDFYWVIHFPQDVAQATGNLTRVEPRTLRTKTMQSDADRITSDFWFDPGDPVGRHRFELVVNDARVYAIDFDVAA